MKTFLQVVSLFGLPLAAVIWYDLYANTEAYQFSFNLRASRPVAIGIHLVTAFLCLHTPLRLWRRFDAMGLRLFCLTLSLAAFWVAVRLASSGRVDHAPLLKSVAVFLIPLINYPLVSLFLFKWSRGEFVTAANPDSSKQTNDDDDHGDS
jgi:hypothetical protein